MKTAEKTMDKAGRTRAGALPAFRLLQAGAAPEPVKVMKKKAPAGEIPERGQLLSHESLEAWLALVPCSQTLGR